MFLYNVRPKHLQSPDGLVPSPNFMIGVSFSTESNSDVLAEALKGIDLVLVLYMLGGVVLFPSIDACCQAKDAQRRQRPRRK